MKSSSVALTPTRKRKGHATRSLLLATLSLIRRKHWAFSASIGAPYSNLRTCDLSETNDREPPESPVRVGEKGDLIAGLSSPGKQRSAKQLRRLIPENKEEVDYFSLGLFRREEWP